MIFQKLMEMIKKTIYSKKEIDNICYDCEEQTENLYKYGGRKFCADCYIELIQKCSWCDFKETDKKELVSVWVENNNEEKNALLCLSCVGKLAKCNNSNCRTTIFKKDNQCESCNFYYCKAHFQDHNCRGNEPSFLMRGVSRGVFNGDIELAQSIKNKRLVGIEIETVNGDPEKMIELDKRVGVAHDGSIKGSSPIELQTPPASANELEGLINNVTKTLKGAGYRVNKSCGVHLHFDSPDFNSNGLKIYKLLSTYYAIEPVVFAMLPKSRRNNEYAQPLRNWIDEPKMMMLSTRTFSKKTLEEEWYKSRDRNHIMSFKGNRYDSSRYHGFNMHCLFKDGHIELRYHHGTLNATKIKNWINLNLTMIDWAIYNYNKNVVDAIFFASTPQDKLRLMVRHCGINRELRRYINRNIKKFSVAEEDDN